MNAAIRDNSDKAGFPARRPGSAALKIFLLLLAVGGAAAAGWVAISSRASASGPEDKALEVSRGIGSSATLVVSGGLPAPDARAEAVREIKEKAAKDLVSLGVTDVANEGDTFCVYVDQRFTAMTRQQQEQLLGLLAAKWKQATAAASVPVRVLNSESRSTLFELSF